MLAPEFARKARQSALVHAQLSVSTISIPESFSGGECRITVNVERVYHGSDDLRPGSSIELSVFCYVPPDRSPTGPRWLDFDKLKVGSFLEAFLNRSKNGKGFEVAMWQIEFIESLTETPRLALWESPDTQASEGFLGSLLRRLSIRRR